MRFAVLAAFLFLHSCFAWCESENGIQPVIEPWNSFTSLFFCISAAYGLYYAPSHTWSYRNVLYLSLWTGIGSAIHHAFITNQETHAYDIVPMTLLSGYLFTYVSGTFSYDLSIFLRTLFGVVSTLLVCAILIAYKQGNTWRDWFIASVFLTVCIQICIGIRWLLGSWSFSRNLLQHLLWCLVVFSIACVSWYADDLLIHENGCYFSLHAIYHICAAWVSLLTLTISLHLRHKNSYLHPLFPKAPFLLYHVKFIPTSVPVNRKAPRHLRNVVRNLRNSHSKDPYKN